MSYAAARLDDLSFRDIAGEGPGAVLMGDNDDVVEDPNNQHPPSFSEMVEGFARLQESDKNGPFLKYILPGLIAVLMALGSFVLYSVNTLQTTVGQMSITVMDMQKTLDSVSRKQDEATATTAQLQTATATNTQRLGAIETRVATLESRVGRSPN